MRDHTPLHAPNSLRPPDSAGSNKENVHSIDSDIESSQPTVLRPPLQALLYANAIDIPPLMRSGLNNGAQGHTFHWAICVSLTFFHYSISSMPT